MSQQIALVPARSWCQRDSHEIGLGFDGHPRAADGRSRRSTTIGSDAAPGPTGRCDRAARANPVRRTRDDVPESYATRGSARRDRQIARAMMRPRCGLSGEVLVTSARYRKWRTRLTQRLGIGRSEREGRQVRIAVAVRRYVGVVASCVVTLARGQVVAGVGVVATERETSSPGRPVALTAPTWALTRTKRRPTGSRTPTVGRTCVALDSASQAGRRVRSTSTSGVTSEAASHERRTRRSHESRDVKSASSRPTWDVMFESRSRAATDVGIDVSHGCVMSK